MTSFFVLLVYIPSSCFVRISEGKKEVREKLTLQTEFYMITNEAFPKRASLDTTTKCAQKNN